MASFWKLPVSPLNRAATRRCLGRGRILLLGLMVGCPVYSGSAQQAGESYRNLLLAIQQRIEQRDFAGARFLLSNAHSKFPSDGGLENLLGVIEIQEGHPDRATQDFKAAIRHAPNLASAYLNLGRIYMQAGDQDKTAPSSALRVYGALLRREPENSEANYQIAMLLLQRQNFQRSKDHLERLSEDDRERLGAQIVLCADEAALGHADAADTIAGRIVAAPDLVEQDGLEMLPALRLAHRADLIELIFTAINDRKPLSPEGLRLLGLAQEGEGKFGIARATLERAFAQDSSSVSILIDLTRVAKASKDFEGALGYLAHARDLRPSDAGFAYEFGVLTIRMGLLGEARKAMGEAVKLAPDNPEYNFGMGIVSSFSQDATQGLPYLEKYHALRPFDPAALLSIGTAYYRGKNFESATVWLKQAATHRTTAADAHYYLGRIARVEVHLDVAKQELEQANKLSPDRPDVLAELGQVATATHEYPKAGAYLDRAIALEPENYAANFGLLQLYARAGDQRKEEQSKRFDTIKNKSEEQYQEMMRVISARAGGSPGI